MSSLFGQTQERISQGEMSNLLRYLCRHGMIDRVRGSTGIESPRPAGGALTPARKNRGFRLQLRWFGHTLSTWESFWVNSNPEAELEGWRNRLGEVLKSWSTHQPGEGSVPDDL